MPKYVINSAGFGAVGALGPSPSLNDPGWANACGMSWPSYLFQPDCWGYSYDQWNTAFYKPATTLAITLPVGPVAPDSALTAPYVVTPAEAQAASDAAILQTQANNAAVNPPSTPDSCTALSANWPWPLDGLTCSGMLLGGLGLVAAFLIIPRLGGR